MPPKQSEKLEFKRITTVQRGQLMSRIKSCNTGPERQLRSLLRQFGPPRLRIRYNEGTLPGKPDAYIPRWKLAIFVDGCFFHVCPKHGHIPKSNRNYWTKKLAGNQSRDNRRSKELRRLGLTVMRFWEHELHSTSPQVLWRRIALMSRR
jgi:DNA mismatch endonuclease, patch repair protein